MCAKWDLERPQHGEMTSETERPEDVAGVAAEERQKIPEGFLVILGVWGKRVNTGIEMRGTSISIVLGYQIELSDWTSTCSWLTAL